MYSNINEGQEKLIICNIFEKVLPVQQDIYCEFTPHWMVQEYS